MTCHRVSKTIHHVTSFESSAYEINRIFNVAYLGFLMFSTIFLNAVAIITIQKTPQLRNRLCYFAILVQSSVDLGVGCFAIPMTIVFLLSPFTNVDLCTIFLFTKSTMFLLSTLSIVTLSTLTMERYLCAIHPVFHRTRLRKKQIVTCTVGAALILLSVVIASNFTSEGDITRVAATGISTIFYIFNIFAYIQIYLVVRRVTQSRVRPNGNAWEENRRRPIFGMTKHVISCFIVLIFFTFLILPYILSTFLVQFETMIWNAYFWWAVTLVILNSSINSVILFWRNRGLRKEAIKFLKNTMN